MCVCIIITDDTVSEVGKLLITDVGLDAGKWRVVTLCSGCHFGNHMHATLQVSQNPVLLGAAS